MKVELDFYDICHIKNSISSRLRFLEGIYEDLPDSCCDDCRKEISELNSLYDRLLDVHA